MKRVLCALAFSTTIALIPSCSSSGLSSSNKAVCTEVAEIMKGSGYMEGTRDSLMTAVIDLAFYDPPYVDDWVTYRTPPQDYAPSLDNNNNPVYQNLYRLQVQAIDYMDSRNSGAFYNEWKYFERGCGFTKE